MDTRTRQRFDEHIHPLVPVLIPPGSEHVQRVVHVEIQVSIEMPAHKVLDLGLVQRVQILELVHRTKCIFKYIQIISR